MGHKDDTSIMSHSDTPRPRPRPHPRTQRTLFSRQVLHWSWGAKSWIREYVSMHYHFVDAYTTVATNHLGRAKSALMKQRDESPNLPHERDEICMAKPRNETTLSRNPLASRLATRRATSVRRIRGPVV